MSFGVYSFVWSLLSDVVLDAEGAPVIPESAAAGIQLCDATDDMDSNG